MRQAPRPEELKKIRISGRIDGGLDEWLEKELAARNIELLEVYYLSHENTVVGDIVIYGWEGWAPPSLRIIGRARKWPSGIVEAWVVEVEEEEEEG